MTDPAFLISKVEGDARALTESLQAAADAGVGMTTLLPVLMGVFREAGMFSGSLADLGLPIPSA